MIFVLIFVIFCAILVPSILYFRRHGFKKITIYLIVANLLFGFVVGLFFVDIPNIRTIETEILFTERNSRGNANNPRLLMFISDNQGNNFWGLWSIHSHYGSRINYTPVRITYLPTTGFVMQIERDFGPPLFIFGIHSDGYRVIYSHEVPLALMFFSLLIGTIVIIFKTSFKDTKPKNKKRKR